jgi:hypothetical protein
MGCSAAPIQAPQLSRWKCVLRASAASKNQLEQPDHHDQPDQKNNARRTTDKLQHVCALLNK